MLHHELKARHDRARDPNKGYSMGAHTRVVKSGNDYAIRYHDTNVVTVAPDGTTTLNSGGWRSKTTKERIADYAEGVHIWQTKGVWYVSTVRGTAVFADGMQIAPDGVITGGLDVSELMKQEALAKAIKKYAKEYSRRLHAGLIGKPSNGDCWGCLMGIKHTDHIQHHIEEGYYVPSLVLRAVEAFGACKITRHNVAYYLKLDGFENNSPFPYAHSEREIATYIKRFCLKECGLTY